MDFLAETNVAGQTLLRLVSRGNAIIAELLRLSDNIPAVFKFTDKNLQRKYQDILFDFRYIKNAELFEHRIENSGQLMDLDQEFKDNHMDILKRFYSLFESIYKYVKDFTQYLTDLEEGVYIQHTLEGVLLNNDGKQLMCEALYVYGVILRLMDELIEGPVRERILISYLRYKGQAEEPLLDDVCKLCKSTGYLPGAKKPPTYPEDYYQRFPLSKTVVHMIIGRLRSDDIYNQIASYPLPEHRSTALATQASMLYIILFFAPEILNDQPAIMREIVDKHFPDNWVITYYLGYTVDLSVEWEKYRAAKAALANTIQLPNVQRLKEMYWKKTDVVAKQLVHYLTEGILTEEFILDSLNKLLACTREANVTIRWIMLHVTTHEKKLRPLLTQDFEADKILRLLLNTAQFEFILKNLFQAMLTSKQAKWDGHKKECSERMLELSEYFSGEKALTRVKRNETLMKWFQDISNQINGLDYADFVLAGRKISQLIQALEQVEEFHQIEQSLQVKQFLVDTRNFLHQMLRIVNVKEEVLVVMGLVGDISYAWTVINDYVPLMQGRIKKDPTSVLKLRATFLKLASIMTLPLIRISQCASPDLFSVSEYYSGELVAFVRKVLEIVPRSMFEVLAQIIDLQTSKLKELPSRLDKDKLHEFAQLDQRYTLAKLTHAISVFTEGILAMETTLVGVIKVDPKQLLEDGIRKQLVLQIATSLDRMLQFKTGKIEDFNARLIQLSSILDGIKRSFQYMSDYINIYGLKIWQEEFSRIVNYNIEQECNSFLKRKIYDWQSAYQSVAIPIPNFPSIDEQSVNFIGRLARELLSLTNCQNTIYIAKMNGWFDKEGREIVGIKTFDLLNASLSTFGLSGLDKLLSFMIVKELQQFIGGMRRELNKEMKAFLQSQILPQLSPPSVLPQQAQKLYEVCTSRTSKLWPLFLDMTTTVGQMALLKKQIANTLDVSCKLDSYTLYNTLDVLNKSLIKDIQQHYAYPESHPYPSDDNPLLGELGKYLENCGIVDPFTKIYITTTPLEHLAVLMFVFVITQASRFQYQTSVGMLMPKKDKRAYDASPFIVGIIVLLKQFHASNTKLFVAYLCQYVKSYINLSAQRESKLVDFPEEVVSTLLFLEQFCRLGNVDRKLVEAHIPAYIFDEFKHDS